MGLPKTIFPVLGILKILLSLLIHALDLIFYVLDVCSPRAFSVFKVSQHSLQKHPRAEGVLCMSFSMFWLLAPPEHSQYSNSYNIAPESILELRGTLHQETEKTLTPHERERRKAPTPLKGTQGNLPTPLYNTKQGLDRPAFWSPRALFSIIKGARGDSQNSTKRWNCRFKQSVP